MASAQPHGSLVRSQRGFTLVEVAISIAIIAVAFVSLLALLPAGNTQFRRAMDLSIAAQIAQRIISDAEQTEFDELIDAESASGAEPEGYTFRAPKRNPDQAALRYFDDQGREIRTVNGQLQPQDRLRMIYQANVRIMPNNYLPSERKAGVPQAAQRRYAPRNPRALVTVQVAHNPANIVLPFSSADASDANEPMRNLWKLNASQAGIAIYTYSATISRH